MAGYPNPVMGNDASQDRASVDKAGQDNVTPTVAVGAGAGAGASASMQSGSNDVRGTVVVNSGTAPPAGVVVTITYAKAYSTTPTVVLTGGGPGQGGAIAVSSSSPTSFTVYALSAIGASTNGVLFNYIVVP